MKPEKLVYITKYNELTKDKFEEAYRQLGELYTPPFPSETAR